MNIYKDKEFDFIEWFNPNNGFLVRSNILSNPSEEATQRSYPELLDIGIMGHCHAYSYGICKKAGIDCYQSADKISNPNMSLELYKSIIEESKYKVFQVALGGRGDPNKHEHFEGILKETRRANIVPNLTTSGILLSDNEISYMKEYCGAVAVSYYSRLKKVSNKYVESNPITTEAISKLVKSGCTVNVHYVLSNDTIEEAIIRLNYDYFPEGVNAVIFILYKPVGNGTYSKVISLKNHKFKELLQMIQTNKYGYKIGFDTCSTPAILSQCGMISRKSVDFCEAARFSMYIDSDLNAYPCSFDCIDQQYMVNIKGSTIKEAWNSEKFIKFRNIQNSSCNICDLKKYCMGGCALSFELNVCGNKDE